MLRFWRVSFQTVAAPVMTALLYLLIFSHVLGERVEVYPGVPYTVFLIPGLIMMSVLQNAFANSSSSLIQSKVMGNIIFVLLFLSGVFYSIHSLPPMWQKISHLNPFFYMIDGFRYGFFGQGDISPWFSLSVVVGFFIALSILTIGMLKAGYKLRG
ncbi:MAG: hypothetical protein EBV25_03360 [Methylophilaceae bacterium]|nr:hypothetical protein [Methylophilaceae bacterium]